MLRAFQEGGASMYGVLCCGGFSHVIALIGIGFMFGKKRGALIGLGATSLLLGVVTLGVGAVGYFYGMRQVDAAVAFADPQMAARLVAQGRSEALNNIWFGMCSCGLPALAGAMVLLKGVMTKREGDPAEAPFERG